MIDYIEKTVYQLCLERGRVTGFNENNLHLNIQSGVIIALSNTTWYYILYFSNWGRILIRASAQKRHLIQRPDGCVVGWFWRKLTAFWRFMKITGPTYKLLLSFTVISDDYRSFISYKTIFIKYCLTQWISKLPGSFEVHRVRQYLVNFTVWRA